MVFGKVIHTWYQVPAPIVLIVLRNSSSHPVTTMCIGSTNTQSVHLNRLVQLPSLVYTLNINGPRWNIIICLLVRIVWWWHCVISNSVTRAVESFPVTKFRKWQINKQLFLISCWSLFKQYIRNILSKRYCGVLYTNFAISVAGCKCRID